MNNIVIFVFLLIIITIVFFSYVHYSKKYEPFEAFYKVPDEPQPMFTLIGSDSQLPNSVNNRQYFKEVQVDEIVQALEKGVTSKVPQPWNTLVLLDRQVDDNERSDIEQLVIHLLNSYVNLYDASTNRKVPFQLKGMSLIEVRSITYDNIPFVFSKWDIMVHRESKLYGFAFEIVMLHVESEVFLCSHSNHTAISEDLLETSSNLRDEAIYIDQSSSSL